MVSPSSSGKIGGSRKKGSHPLTNQGSRGRASLQRAAADKEFKPHSEFHPERPGALRATNGGGDPVQETCLTSEKLQSHTKPLLHHAQSPENHLAQAELVNLRISGLIYHYLCVTVGLD